MTILRKPFSYNELINRTKALLRRCHVYKGKTEILEPSKVISYHGLTIDEQTEQVSERWSDHRPHQYGVLGMLVLLIKHCGQVFPQSICMNLYGKNPIITGQIIQ